MGPFSRRQLGIATLASICLLELGMGTTMVAERWTMPLVAAAAVFGLVLLVFLVQGQLEDRIEQAAALSDATFALYQVLQPVEPLPLLDNYALGPDAALLLHRLVRDRRPEVVVETGSGASTLVIAYTLKQNGGGRLISLEHDESYARRTRQELIRHGLEKWVTIAHAPLVDVEVDGKTFQWHETKALGAVSQIDLVFDDGPPRRVGPELRYAALPCLSPKLAPDAVYCVNYIADEERKNVERWLERDVAWRAQWLRTKKGNVLLRRG